jgi:hypothetical protein
MFEIREIISESTSVQYKISVLNTERGICMPSFIASKMTSKGNEKELFTYDNPSYLSGELLNTIIEDLNNGGHSLTEIPREDYLEIYVMLCHAKALGWLNEK